ncbi:hypothetical protein [Miltoncostaea marina]|uniref:hypothetical protein n=1 Tax=Miltoncostaea marina TaxID=2843215 RepID=UPI001C3E733D|nr:hypothetical protein [Miltoncostaea marina]
MSTDQSTGQRLAAAIDRLEKLVKVQEQLPAQIDGAKAEVVAIMDELGIEAKPARRRRKPASPVARPGGPRRRASGPLAPDTQAVLDFLRDRGPATLDTMSVELAMDRTDLARRLGSLAQGASPRVARDDEHRDLWRLVGVPHGNGHSPVEAAALEAAGVEA